MQLFLTRHYDEIMVDIDNMHLNNNFMTRVAQLPNDNLYHKADYSFDNNSRLLFQSPFYNYSKL